MNRCKRKGVFVDEGADGGRYATLNIGGFMFIVYDGAFNIYSLTDCNPGPTEVGNNPCLKAVAISLKQCFKITVSCAGEVDLPESNDYNAILEVLKSTD